MRRLLLLLIVLAPLAGCAAASASGKVAGGPALNVPPPPEHVVEPPIEPTEPVPDLPPPNPAAGTRPSRPAANAPKSSGAETKTEAKPGETKPPETEPPPIAPVPPPPPAPNAQLRTPATADTNAEKTVRDTIDRARGTLATVNYGPLSNERKKAYNDVKSFMQQAEDALKQGNLVFAQAVATKAETLAKELSGR